MRELIPIPILLTALTLVCAFLVIWRAAAMRFTSKTEWLIHVIASVLSFFVVYIAAPWPFMSTFLRMSFLILYIGTMGWSAWQLRALPLRGELPRPALIKRIILIIGAAYLSSQLIMGMFYYDTPVKLHFPLRNGNYYIMQGGGSRFSNLFHSSASWRKFGYAVDIAKLYPWGNRAKNIFSRNNRDYAIFRDTVYAPCAGKVILAYDSIKDNIPGKLSINPVSGNCIIIQYSKYRVALVHLTYHGLLIKEGEVVHSGQPLALQGNTGFSIEPHLHIHVWRDYELDPNHEGTSVPILFDGHFLSINKIVHSEQGEKHESGE